MYTIVILALVAGFLALRLYAVLGKRTGHEQQPEPPARREERPMARTISSSGETLQQPELNRAELATVSRNAESGVRAIMSADRNFDVARFLDGAKSAYDMILNAFWQGKAEDLRWLCADDVAQSFEQAIKDREAAGHVLENRLVRIEKARIADASLEGSIAHVTVELEADVAALTRDAQGHVIAGSLTDAETTHDLWTFTRDLRDRDPNWKLSATDEAA